MGYYRVGTENYTKKPRSRIDMIVLHATAGPSGTSAINWMTNPKSRVSCHYLVDKAGLIYQLVDEKYKAWHAGKSKWKGEINCNRFSIGIELVNDNLGEPYRNEQLISLLDLSIDIINRHNIPIKRIVRHADISPGRKTDPYNFPWDWYIKEVKRRIKWQNKKMVSEQQNSGSRLGQTLRRFWQRLAKFFRPKRRQ